MPVVSMTSRRLASCATTLGNTGNGLSSTSPIRGNQPPYYIADGNPPLSYNGGQVMNGAGAVVVTPIYWAPTGFSIPASYEMLTTRFVNDVAAAGGSSTNVFSILTQYQTSGSLETSYDITAGAALTDTTTYPTTGGCTKDAGAVYPDGSGYSTCITNAQIQTELTTFLSNLHLTSDVHHLYIVLLPEGVETCINNANGAASGSCSPNAADFNASFCGYHSYGTGPSSAQVYAVLPYAVTGGALGPACSSQDAPYADTSLVGAQTPNGNIDADSEISVMSHEMSEAITDPYLTAWKDASRYEVGDECAYIYGDSLSLQGAPGAQYNQTINGDHYFIQEEFSN